MLRIRLFGYSRIYASTPYVRHVSYMLFCVQVHEFNVGKDQITSKMEIDPTTQRDSGYYECQADNKYAVDKRGFRTDYTLDVY